MEKKIKIIECPRDAMQGLHDFVPTELKIDYINSILRCGFDTVDFGSFVSPKAIPQMADTEKVLDGLIDSPSKLLAIVANERGAQDAASFDRIQYLGYPFSVSEEFQKRNTNSTISESFGRVESIKSICDKSGKELVIYLSMGFGNPYGEHWAPELVATWSTRLYNELGINIQALSDTIGAATPEIVQSVFSTLVPSNGNIEFGAHLHTKYDSAFPLIKSAYDGGCRRFDGAIKGFGGCPMATDDLTGNMPTELILNWFNQHDIATGISSNAFDLAMQKSMEVFP